jgi:dTDP-4-dehydrorhamnose reductase
VKTLVLGKGFLGSEFERQGFEVWGREKYEIGQDLSFLNKYDVVINCIGKSDTRWCEHNMRGAMNANTDFPVLLSRTCNLLYNTKFVHISTGCLYDESHRPCTEDDFLVAHCNYTVTKFAAEKLINPDKDLIIRPRLLYGGERRSGNNLLCKLPQFKAYVDEFNSVTSVKTIVEATTALLDADQTGVFNVADEGIHTIGQIAKMVGYVGEKMTGEQLRRNNGLYLVNNVMSLDKLKQFYQPPTVEERIKECQKELQEEWQ